MARPLPALCAAALACAVFLVFVRPALAEEYPGWDLIGGDYQSIELSAGSNAWDQCVHACVQDVECMAASMISGPAKPVCRLKRMGYDVEENPQASSYVKPLYISAQANMAYPDGDYEVFELFGPNDSAEECRIVCQSDTRCLGFTYAAPGVEATHGVCHLKESLSQAVSAPSMFTGVIYERMPFYREAVLADLGTTAYTDQEATGLDEEATETDEEGTTETDEDGTTVPDDHAYTVPMDQGATIPPEEGATNLDEEPVGLDEEEATTPDGPVTTDPEYLGAPLPTEQRDTDSHGQGTLVPVEEGTTVPVEEGTTVPVEEGTTVPVEAGTTVPDGQETIAPVGTEWRFGVEFPGNDYFSFYLPEDRPEQCREACANDPDCKAFTYFRPGALHDHAACRLKDGVPETLVNPDALSGIMPDN